MTKRHVIWRPKLEPDARWAQICQAKARPERDFRVWVYQKTATGCHASMKLCSTLRKLGYKTAVIAREQETPLFTSLLADASRSGVEKSTRRRAAVEGTKGGERLDNLSDGPR